MTVAGTLTLTSGTLAAGSNLTMGAASNIARSGGDMTGTPQGANAYSVTYTGSSKTTGTELAGSGLNNVTNSLTAGQTLTLDTSRTPDGNLTITTGIFDIGANTINRSTQAAR